MAKKDLTAKQLESIPEVFADIFNGLEFYDKEQLRIDPYRQYMCNFSIKVIDTHLLQDADYERFTSDFGPVVSFLNAKDKDFFGIYKELKYPLEALSMIHAYKHLDNYEEIRNDIYMRTKKGEAVNMGTLIDIVRAEGKAEGKVESLYYDADFSIEQIAEKLKMSEEEVKGILSMIDR